MAPLIGFLIGQLIGVGIGSLIGAIILRAAAKWVEKIDVPFGNAYVTVLLSGIVNLILGFIVGFCVGASTGSQDAVNVASLFMLPIGFLIQSGFISSRIQIPFGRACVLTLAMIGIGLVVGLVIAIPIALFVTFAI